MAKKEHLNLLKQGVDAWNAWRKEHSDIQPDLREAQLLRANLSEAELSAADLRWSNLRNAVLNRTNLSEVVRREVA